MRVERKDLGIGEAFDLILNTRSGAMQIKRPCAMFWRGSGCRPGDRFSLCGLAGGLIGKIIKTACRTFALSIRDLALLAKWWAALAERWGWVQD